MRLHVMQLSRLVMMRVSNDLENFIALLVVIFAVTLLFITKPISASGRFALKLALVNAVGWLLILPLPDDGHPPLSLIGYGIFWLINLVLLPAATIALWLCYKEREEKKSYVAVAAAYLGLNFVVLFLIPLIWLVRSVA